MRKLPLSHWTGDVIPLHGPIRDDEAVIALCEKTLRHFLHDWLAKQASAHHPKHHARLQVTKGGDFRQFLRRDARLVRRR
jgi:hypothetical protein